ncbi:unnamed protein product [Brassica oleracea]
MIRTDPRISYYPVDIRTYLVISLTRRSSASENDSRNMR